MKIPFPKNFQAKQPSLIHDILEIAIVFYSPQIYPQDYSLNKLRKNRVIPRNWQLKKGSQAHISANNKQFIFKQGLKVNIVRGRIGFSYQINKKTSSFYTIAVDFLHNCADFNINKSEINLRRLISLPGDKDRASKFIKETILNQGEWQNFHDLPMRAEVNFLYHLANNLALMIKIADFKIRSPNQKNKSALLFYGTFNYEFKQVAQRNYKLTKLKEEINKCQEKIDIFNYIINQKFLGNQ